MKKNKKKRSLLLVLTVLLLAEIAAFSGYEAYQIISEYKREETASQQIQQFIDLEATQGAEPITEVQETEAEALEELGTVVLETEAILSTEAMEETEPVYYPVVDFESLMKINSDVIGWIYIPGTNVNYPIVQGDDNRHYVSTMVDGRDNAAGSIFMDYRNSPDFLDKHTVIYGHNMRNGSMFANIVDYKKDIYLQEHSVGMIMTPTVNFRLQVIGGYVAKLSDSAWQLEFAGEDDFNAWLEETLNHTGDRLAVQPKATDRIITLSTCSYEFSDARYVLVCRVME